MKRHGVRRIIVVSAAGGGDSREVSAPEIMDIVDQSNVAVSFNDLANMEDVLLRSGLDTLSLRPVTLVDGGPSDSAQRVERYEATLQISKGSVASLMLEALKRPVPFAHKTEIVGQLSNTG
ncbi:NAD(P)H-binding protein [Shimia sp. MIT1388]|uniref:NAD(P)H-binding protein n=1 Tax=Shimia sp. MIT1388 TaxID=3096992 RepID=UPI00399C1ACC